MCVQMIPVFEAECVEEARSRGATLPSEWSPRVLLEAITEAMMDVQTAVLQTATRLRRSGTQKNLKWCIVGSKYR